MFNIPVGRGSIVATRQQLAPPAGQQLVGFRWFVKRGWILMSDRQQVDEAQVVQNFGNVQDVRLGLSADVRHRSIAALNRMLAHAMAMRDLYKKAHWQTSGATFFELHTMFDAHYTQQLEIVDTLAERVQMLGGVSLATSQDVVSESRIARAPRGRESPTAQLTRLVEAHEMLLMEARPLARAAADAGDDGTNDLLVGDVIRPNEKQAWFVGEHLADGRYGRG